MNTVKFIGMDVHKNSITIAILKRGVGIQPESTAPSTTIWMHWINFVVKWSPLLVSFTLSTKPAPAVMASTAI